MSKTLPYVYICIHKTTKEFYIGARFANVVSPEEDLGIRYKTSSKAVRPRFAEFDFHVIAMFFTADSAWLFEQQLISETIDDVLSLNQCVYSQCGPIIHTTGRARTADERSRISASKTGKPRTSYKPPRKRVARIVVEYTCSGCDKNFTKEFTVGDAKQFITNRYCSYSCSNKHNRKMRNK